MKLLSGKLIANIIEKEITRQIKKLGATPKPFLAVIVVGNHPATDLYVCKKQEKAKKMGIKVRIIRLSEKTSEKEIISKIEVLNSDSRVNGILVQLPLPKKINIQKIIWSVDSKKDVDGFQMKDFRPPAPLAILDILLHYKIPVYKRKVTLVGYGTLIGKPLSVLLTKQGANITICDENTKNLKAKILDADIVVSAVGKSNLITAEMVKEGQIIIDAGTTTDSGTFTGDVDFAGVSKKVSAITPVPGGIGPLTIMELFKNLLRATEKQINFAHIIEAPNKKNNLDQSADIGPFIKRMNYKSEDK